LDATRDRVRGHYQRCVKRQLLRTVAVPRRRVLEKSLALRRLDCRQRALLGYPAFRAGFMGKLINERPMCPACKHRMALARIAPGERDFEVRVFECSTCERTEQISMSVDPMQTDAVGWLASKLWPPR
jgi:hypothetical protein